MKYFNSDVNVTGRISSVVWVGTGHREMTTRRNGRNEWEKDKMVEMEKKNKEKERMKGGVQLCLNYLCTV